MAYYNQPTYYVVSKELIDLLNGNYVIKLIKLHFNKINSNFRYGSFGLNK